MTHTSLDLTPFGAVLQGVGVLYWLLVLVALGLALFKPKRRWIKAVAVSLVLAVMVAPVVYYQLKQHRLLQEAIARRDAAWNYFQARCKDSGEKIARTVNAVDGVLLLKLRPKWQLEQDADPAAPGAAFQSESAGDWYIRSFLFYEWRDKGYENTRGYVNPKPTSRPGYRYVDFVDPKDGLRYRYTIELGEGVDRKNADANDFQLMRKPATEAAPRYGVTFEDIVDPEDRKHWIAGSTVRVLDMQTKEIVAEQTRFVFDTGLGSTGGSRNPWGWAANYGKHCPVVEGNLASQTRFFVDKVLVPVGGE